MKQEIRIYRWIGWFCIAFALLLCSIFVEQLPEEMKVPEAMRTVEGVYQALERVTGSRSYYWELHLQDGEVWKVSRTIGFARRDFEDAVSPGDEIVLYPDEDGWVQAIYRADGRAVHSFEQTYAGQTENSMVGFCVCAIFLLVGLIFALRPELVLRLDGKLSRKRNIRRERRRRKK